MAARSKSYVMGVKVSESTFTLRAASGLFTAESPPCRIFASMLWVNDIVTRIDLVNYVSHGVGKDGAHPLALFAKVINVNLVGSLLRGADLTAVNLSEAGLIDAELRDAKLRNANLSGADLYRADLTGADLSGADLSGSRLTGAILTNAKLEGAKLSGALMPDGTTHD